MNDEKPNGIYGILSEDGFEHYALSANSGYVEEHRRACLSTGELLEAVRKGFIRSVWCSDIKLLSANPNAALELAAFLDWHDVPLNLGTNRN